jgi:hypothetical protein
MFSAVPSIRNAGQCNSRVDDLSYDLLKGMVVPPKSKFWISLFALAFVLASLKAPSAFAITADVAKNCGALATKAYPLRSPGNPAGGRINGTGADFQKYFNQCVANGGKMPEQAPTQSNTPGVPASREGGNPSNQAPK